MTTTFWKNGLNFHCHNCGQCCQGAPGTIYFSNEEIDNLALALQMDRELLIKKYFYPYKDAYSARDDNENFKCVFYNNGCTIYEHRPQQCRAFPFWKSLLESKELWDSYARHCPGMKDSNTYHPSDEIINIASNSPI